MGTHADRALHRVPLSYALAYGGASAEPREAEDTFWQNPFGRGFRGRTRPTRPGNTTLPGS
ncbi:MAG: DUF2169 domain-containing protein [Sterolibacteriaceae bacterium]|nr:DUF2169 domain-containing protein [Candidatus Methylophosphatis haderslevensis]